MSSKLISLFTVLTVVKVYGELQDVPILPIISKPLLMPILMVIYHQSISFKNKHQRQNVTDKFNILVQCSLFFSWWGDNFVQLNHIYSRKSYFIYGILSFLLAHIFYIAIYFMEKPITNPISKSKDLLLYIIYFGLAQIVLYIIIPKIDEKLLYAVIVYTLVLTTMGRCSWFRYGQVTYQSFESVVIGAILFIISDLSIAIFKFGIVRNHYGIMRDLIIMPTYCLGQYMIIDGLIKGNLKHIKK